MYNAIRQLLTLTGIGLRTIPQRRGPAGITVLSIGGVVLVLVSILSMVVGLGRSMHNASDSNRAIVLRGGAISEIGSVLSADDLHRIENFAGLKKDEAGRPLVSAEMIRLVGLDRKRDGINVDVVAHGIQMAAFSIRPEIRITAGRNFKPGTAEMIVGKSANEQFHGLEIGDQVYVFERRWTVVGQFETGGDQRESELLVNSDVLRGSNPYQSAMVELTDIGALADFKSYLNAGPTATFDVFAENDYLSRSSGGVQGLISILAYVVGSIMAIGAIFAAVNAMHYAVDVRTREIATLRAMGFGTGVTAGAVLLEALLLALGGGILGGALAWLLVDGHTATTAVGLQVKSQLVFHLTVSWQLFLLGLVLAGMVGLVGGIFPAIRASSLPVVVALRSL